MELKDQIMRTYDADVCIVGSGPAGLGAAIELAKHGLHALVVDSNLSAGGQLIKQTHKFFGPTAHRGGVRGMVIADELYAEALDSGVEVWLDSEVYSVSSEMQERMSIEVLRNARRSNSCDTLPIFRCAIKAKYLVIASGASEKPLMFPGWTLPGVMGAGAVQTVMNVERVLPGERFLIVGSGNVGLILAYQLLQAGAKISCVIDSAPTIGGYAVHAGKVQRAGVPLITRCTIVKALGDNQVKGGQIARLDENCQIIESSVETVDVDTICIAVGLKPYARLASLAGCKFGYFPQLGGWVPLHNDRMMTTVENVYVAGDVAGVEEAAIAEDEGRLAGLDIVLKLRPDDVCVRSRIHEVQARLWESRRGPFSSDKHQAKKEIIGHWHGNVAT